MKVKLKRAAKIVLALFLALILLVGGWLGWLAYVANTRAPQLDGALAAEGLAAPVRIVRDDWGTPHIYAENEADAHFALGYVMGQERMFQMELLRRLARGELSELLGPLTVPVDRIVRAFRLRASAQSFIEAQAADYPGLMAAAQAFASGLNHSLHTDPVPFEFTALGIPIRDFTVTDCLAVAAILPITFADGLREDPLASILEQRLPEEAVRDLFPGYHREVPVTVMESLEEARAYLQEKRPPAYEVPGVVSRRGDVEQALMPVLAALEPLTGLFGNALGSNAWLVSGARTASGMPILANDPHIGFTNPGVWFEAHLVYEDIDSYGHYLPLIPFPLLSHNRDRAWGLTMFANDDIDLFREEFHPNDPTKVRYKGEWTDVRIEHEHINVRFWKDVDMEVRITPHGPVLTDLFHALHGYEGPDISLSWVWQHIEYTDILAVYRMLHAKDYDAFADAVPYITSPGLNFLYADKAGNIAWWAAGRVVVRPDHVNPKRLLDGASGKDEILGFVPFSQNPHLKNPPWGYIASANNKSTIKPVGAVEDLQGYWQPTDRAGRIEALLQQRDDWTIEAMKAVQFDNTARAAPDILTVVFDALDGEDARSPLEQDALEQLRAWDHAYEVDAVGATLYQGLVDAILEHALRDELGPRMLRVYCTVADHWNFFKWFMQTPGSAFWDNLDTDARETRETVIAAAFKDTVRGLHDKLGGGVDTWTWGRVHTMEFKHPFGYIPGLGGLFNLGPFPAAGGNQIVNNMLYMGDNLSYDVVAGPSTRRLIDYADPENSLTVLPTGNSGRFTSPHYGDQAEMFIKGEYRAPRFTQAQIEAHTAHTLTLQPKE